MTAMVDRISIFFCTVSADDKRVCS
jgi:hypothetical protein